LVQRGRKSQYANVVPLNAAGKPRVQPPSWLSVAEKALFLEIVGASDPRHFVKTDLPLLITYIQAVLLVKKLAPKTKSPDAAAVASWERAVRTMAMLSTRLRLAPQARLDPKTVGRFTGEQVSDERKPWERDDE